MAYDARTRVVSIDVLRAMCEHVSGTAHTYSIVKESRSRVHVEYSNPDEYGRAKPMQAVYPCYPGDNVSTPYVVMDIMRIFNDNWNGEGWQAFTPLQDCPQLFKDPNSGEWRSYVLETDLRELETALLVRTDVLRRERPDDHAEILARVKDLRHAMAPALERERRGE